MLVLMYLKHELFCLKDWSVTCLCLGCIKNFLMPERYNDVFVTFFPLIAMMLYLKNRYN